MIHSHFDFAIYAYLLYCVPILGREPFFTEPIFHWINWITKKAEELRGSFKSP